MLPLVRVSSSGDKIALWENATDALAAAETVVPTWFNPEKYSEKEHLLPISHEGSSLVCTHGTKKGPKGCSACIDLLIANWAEPVQFAMSEDEIITARLACGLSAIQTKQTFPDERDLEHTSLGKLERLHSRLSKYLQKVLSLKAPRPRAPTMLYKSSTHESSCNERQGTL